MQQGYTVESCYNCGQPRSDGCACQFFKQMYGFANGVLISSPGKRFVAYLLEIVLATVTLVLAPLFIR